MPAPPAVSGPGRLDPPNPHNRITSAGAVDSLCTVQMPSAGVPGLPPAMPGPPAMPDDAMRNDAMRNDAMPNDAVPDDAIPATLPTMAGLAPPLTAPPSLPPSRYQLGDEIARGGMGRVVDALDTRLGRTVAFKEALTGDRDALQRFEREIRITARLEHPSIVPVHDAGESGGGAPFYVMRKVSGRPLEKLVAGAGTLGQRLALIPHIVDSAQAIAHAHERGIVHRDIKPSNILVGDLGETVVIDWGLAKVIGEPEPAAPVGRPLVDLTDTLKTRAGIVYGTPGFMAPEQLCGAPVDERCDVYALGATLYHLLARTPPHHAKTADEMMKAAVAAPPTPIRELVPGVPLDLSTVVDKALAHDPTTRYQNARALAEDLQRFLTGQLVASHHYTPREKLIRFVRKNRGVSAAVAALIVVGSVLMVRIYVERNRAQRAEIVAETQRAEAERRAEELTLNQARYNVDVNPTRAVLMVKPLAARYWREVRAIAAAAHAAGVAWSLPAAQETRSLEMSHDGTRAVSAGSDGVVRVHDLVHRTTRQVLDLRAPALARFGDGGRRIVAWHDRQLVIADPETGQRRDVTAQRPIADLEVVGTTAYWVDGTPDLWRLDLAGQTPLALPIDEPLGQLAPSPDGRWIALAGEHHLYFLDRSRPDAPALKMMLGATHEMVWSSTGEFLDAVIDDSVISYQMTPAPDLIDRKMIDRKLFGPRLALAHHGTQVYVLGATGVVMLGPHGIDRRSITGSPAGLAEARGDTMIAGASDGITVMSEDGDRVLPLTAARVEWVVASPRSPYLLAQVEGRLLLYNLDDIQPRRLSDNPTGVALFADPDHVIAGGTDDQAAQAIDLTARTAARLGEWQDLRGVTSAGPGRAIAILDGERRVHLVVPGKPPEDLPGEIDIAAFATDTQLVLATLDGHVFVHDLARGARTPLVERTSPLLGLAWGRGHHAWVAAAFGDGTLWRKNLATGATATAATATAARVPPIDPRRLAARDGKLLVGPDGVVMFLHDGEVHTWRADGTLGLLARAPKPLEEFGEAGPDHIVAIAGDTTVYMIDLTPAGRGAIREALASIASSSAAMAPDTGMLVAIERGALTILDPLVHQRWTLAPPGGATFMAPAISADGRRVVAGTPRSLLAWSIDLPDGAAATARWLDAMTNAVDDRTPGGLGWR
jgi:hypothetical protein